MKSENCIPGTIVEIKETGKIGVITHVDDDEHGVEVWENALVGVDYHRPKDLRSLTKRGYLIRSVMPLDQFKDMYNIDVSEDWEAAACEEGEVDQFSDGAIEVKVNPEVSLICSTESSLKVENTSGIAESIGGKLGYYDNGVRLLEDGAVYSLIRFSRLYKPLLKENRVLYKNSGMNQWVQARASETIGWMASCIKNGSMERLEEIRSFR